MNRTPRSRGDEQKLQQVLLNLLVNAESAMEGTQVRHLSLMTQRKQGMVQIDRFATRDTECRRR